MGTSDAHFFGHVATMKEKKRTNAKTGLRNDKVD